MLLHIDTFLLFSFALYRLFAMVIILLMCVGLLHVLQKCHLFWGFDRVEVVLLSLGYIFVILINFMHQ